MKITAAKPSDSKKDNIRGADAVIVGVFEGHVLLDGTFPFCGPALSNPDVSRLVKHEPSAARVVALTPGFPVLIAVGLGKSGEVCPKTVRLAARAGASLAADLGFESVACDLGLACDLPQWTDSKSSLLSDVAFELASSGYSFDMKTSPKKAAMPKRAAILSSLKKGAASESIARGLALAEGQRIARNLANAPANLCGPDDFAKIAKKLARECGLEFSRLDLADIEKLKMGALLAVSKGSAKPPVVVVVKLNAGPKKQRPTVLVGKGVTFDSGGISLKPGEGMEEMKFDMSGAACVLGAICAAAKAGLRANVCAVIPLCENMPDGNASRPGDVVSTMSGKTVEILNTDAEGRLILCDAIEYSKRLNPEAIVDVATLTGACVVALGAHASGLVSNNDALADEIISAGERSGDRAWRLPLWDEYSKQVKGTVADLANLGGKGAGAITAACFLHEFAKDQRWAHLDIAGTAWKDKFSTGRPVPLLFEFLMAKEKA